MLTDRSAQSPVRPWRIANISKRAWRFVLRLTALHAAADSEGCPAPPEGVAFTLRDADGGLVVTNGPRRGTSGTVAPPCPSGPPCPDG